MTAYIVAGIAVCLPLAWLCKVAVCSLLGTRPGCCGDCGHALRIHQAGRVCQGEGCCCQEGRNEV